MTQPGAASSKAGVPTIAIIETLRESRATSILIALALARPRSVRVVVSHWHGLDFSGSNVRLREAYYRVTDDLKFEACAPNANDRVDALFFDGPESGTLDAHDALSLQKLSRAGMDMHGLPLYKVIDGMMLEASCRGVMTNALGTSQAGGPKHNQELKLRRYEKATGRRVDRPETYIARPHEVQGVLSIFASRSQNCLLKPVYGEGGCGLRIVHPGQSVSPPSHTLVVQQLIADPLLLGGHKADLRCYLLVDVNNRSSSKRLHPVFLRRAFAAYVPATEAAEITNTNYRARHGLAPDMCLLMPMADISPRLCDEITTKLDLLAIQLLDAYFLDLVHGKVGSAVIPNRLILFGVDVLVAVPANAEPRLYFLEANPFPAFFRGVPACDAAIEEMFSAEYLPALRGSAQT
jgi:hypothetical protein